MTVDQYRKHPKLSRAFFRGVNAARAGAQINPNPYRKVQGSARARRGSWSEAYTRAYAAGWRFQREQVRLETGV
jgi:hypothetical protein